MYLPTTKQELDALGWERPDAIIITGDTYIDSPYIGAAVIGKVLAAQGFKVGIIAQPNLENDADITRLGEPRLFWGVTSGSVDSLVANYTASKKRRQRDDFTPGGINNRRPDRAVIAYTNLIRRYFKNTRPIVLGGIEASLRRVAHYDYWSDSIRRSLLFDAKADYLVYGMSELAVLEIAAKLQKNEPLDTVRGLCYIAAAARPNYLTLPAYDAVKNDPQQFERMFHLFYQNSEPLTARGLCQQQDSRFLIHNPPGRSLTMPELDAVHELDYERDVHPFYQGQGPVPALETIKFSLTTHRGCYGECNFCSIAVHQGRTIQSRSEDSVVREAAVLAGLPDFKGYILDVGGPTANMYGGDCPVKLKKGACLNKRCLFPEVCPNLPTLHHKQIRLLQRIRRIPGIKKVFIASGIRYDLILDDQKSGRAYLRELIGHHISGQLKIAPEHSEDRVLKLMGKPPRKKLQAFHELFHSLNRENAGEHGKRQFLTYYLIAAHPGCEMEDMHKLREFAAREMKLRPEQVQIYTPLPSTYSALMYYTGWNPFTGERLFSEKNPAQKERQKQAVVASAPSRPRRSKRIAETGVISQKSDKR